MAETVIELKNVTKKYSVSFAKQSLVGNVLSCFKKKPPKQEIFALNDVSFSVEKGQTLGIIGENASGKTTLLRIISGITFSAQGEVKVQGKVAGLLDPGAGFHPELTGRENIYLDAALFGLRRRAIEALCPQIIEFSGLDNFIDAQVKTYSQGMLVRLGFSVAVHIEPDIFLIDDSIAVGDEEFQRKCVRKIEELKEKGKTIVIVSHDLESLSRICQRGLLLKNGNIIKDDLIHRAIVRYVEAVGDKKSVGCIDRGRLSLIFNNGRLILLWDGQPLTKNWGGYISLMVKEKWVPSWQAEWSLVESRSDCFRFKGILPRCGATINLEVCVQDEFTFGWRINIEAPHAAGVKKVVMGLMLGETYNHFLNETRLELIKKQHALTGRWHDLYITDEDNALLALTSKEGLPAVAARFNEKDNYKGICLIQKTDKELDAIVLQLQGALQNREEEKTSAGVSISCEGRIELLTEGNFSKLILAEQKRRNIQAGSLSVFLNQKKFQIFYNKLELTKEKGLVFGFYYRGYYFNIFDGQWRIDQRTENSIIVSSEFKHLALNFDLLLKLKQDELSWQLNCNDQRDAEIYLLAEVFLKEQYSHYFDIAKKKRFLAATDVREKVALEYSDCGFIGLLGPEAGSASPAVVLEGEKDSQLQLENASADVDARILGLRGQDNHELRGQLKFIDTEKQREEFIIKRKQAWEKETILDNGKLRLVPSSNQIRIYCDKFELTAEEGLTSNIFFNDRWHGIMREFKVVAKNKNKMVIKAKLKILPVEEYWHFELDESVINWSVFFNILEPVENFDYRAGIVLKSHFTQWVNAYEKGYFGIDRITTLESTLLGAKTNSIDQPAVLFKSIDADKIAEPIVQDIEGKRFLQFKLGMDKKVSETTGEKKVFSGKIMILKLDSWQKEIDDYCRQNFSLCTTKDIKLFIAPKAVQFICQDRIATKYDGLKFYLLANDARHIESTDATWHIHKNGPDKIEIVLVFENISLIQKWYFEAKKDHFVWTIRLEVKEKLIIKKMNISIQLAPFFNRWFTEKQVGTIGDLEKDGLRAIMVVDNRSDFIGMCIDESTLSKYLFVLNPLLNMQDWTLHLIKHRDKKDMLKYAVSRIINPKDGLVLDAGVHEIFKAKLILGEDKKTAFSTISTDYKSDKIYNLTKESLMLQFNRAKCKIFWKNQELTKSLCLYSGFCIAGDWFISHAAHWQIESDTCSANIALYWNELLVFQKWHLELSKNNEILWQVETDIKQADVDTVVVALMVSNQFDCWQTENGIKNKFPEHFHRICHTDQFSSAKEAIGVFSSEKKLPSLFFKSSNKNYNQTNFIENPDIIHASRLLKCELKDFLLESNRIEPITFQTKISLSG